MRKVVLREEEYLRILEGILRREYFPDLPPLLAFEEREYTLAQFQSQYTTQDDASFTKLLEKANAARSRLFNQRYTNPQSLLSPNVSFNLIDNNTASSSNLTINPSNTRILANNAVYKKPTATATRKNFVPMTPITASDSPHSTTNSAASLSPAARNLLRSVRKRQLHSASPFGGSTPQRKSTN
jgi:hypothetical protein